jgi:hypothetical protein
MIIGIQLSKNPVNHSRHTREEQVKEMFAGRSTSGAFTFVVDLILKCFLLLLNLNEFVQTETQT